MKRKRDDPSPSQPLVIILDYDWLKDNRKYWKPMTLREMKMKIWCENFEKSFLEWEKMASRKIFGQFLHAIF